MVDRSTFKKSLTVWLVLSALGASSAAAQASIEVVASSRRDGISVSNFRQQIGIAEDGTIAFGANTAAGFDRLMIAGPSGIATDSGLSARNGGDVAINDDSIVFYYGSQVLAVRRDVPSTTANVVQDCLDAATPCGGERHVSLSSDGYFAMTAYDSGGGFYKGRIRNGFVISGIEPVPVFPAFISALGVDARQGGPMMVLGDHSAQSAEVYGAFQTWPSRWAGYFFMNTAVSTRPRGGNEGPFAAAYGDLQPLALMPAQTDGMGTTLAGPALVRGAAQPYGTLQVTGTPLLPLQSAAGGSMDANDFGLAALVATLPSGWAGLFTFNTVAAGAQPVQLVALHVAGLRRKCGDFPISMHVLGTNNAGQIAVLARVQDSTGIIDNQVWRVTPTPTQPTSTSYCWSPLRWIWWP
jgi:hypothetical protein